MNHSAPKILYTASSSAHLVSFHLPYLAALRSLGWDVTAAANGSGEDLGEGVRFLAVPFTKSFASPKNFRAAALLARDICKNRYDVIVTHTSLAAFFTRLGVMLAGKKHTRVVNTVHGYLFDGDSGALRRTVLLAAEKLTAGVTDDILVMNRCDEQIAKKHRLCRGNVYFIPGIGVDFSRFPPPRRRSAPRQKRRISCRRTPRVSSAPRNFPSAKTRRCSFRRSPGCRRTIISCSPATGRCCKSAKPKPKRSASLPAAGFRDGSPMCAVRSPRRISACPQAGRRGCRSR